MARNHRGPAPTDRPHRLERGKNKSQKNGRAANQKLDA